jgi:hypothetical protein
VHVYTPDIVLSGCLQQALQLSKHRLRL